MRLAGSPDVSFSSWTGSLHCRQRHARIEQGFGSTFMLARARNKFSLQAFLQETRLNLTSFRHKLELNKSLVQFSLEDVLTVVVRLFVGLKHSVLKKASQSEPNHLFLWLGPALYTLRCWVHLLPSTVALCCTSTLCLLRHRWLLGLCNIVSEWHNI